MLGYDLRPCLRESSLPKPPPLPRTPPPHPLLVFTCVTLSVAHILVIPEDWLLASYEDGRAY